MLCSYETTGSYRVGLSRRRFVRSLAFSGLALLLPSPVFAAICDYSSRKRSLSLYNPNTRESLDTIYWSDGKYIERALTDINHIMRDRWTGEVKPIDTRLLDLLYAIQRETEIQKPFHVISGYRSPKTNTRLRKGGEGAAKNSFHILAKAADIRLPGYRLSSLRRVAANLKSGGVGYYPHLRFVHVDVGPVRYWSSRIARNPNS